MMANQPATTTPKIVRPLRLFIPPANCNSIALPPVLFSWACLLCPLKIPTRPKPLDQFRLPSIQKIIDTADSITGLCHNDTDQKLKLVGEACRKDVSHLFCSLSDLIDYSKRECPGTDNAEECAKCQRESSSIYDRNSWILTWVDSIGKMPSGISDGNYHWLGDYEQCQRLKDDHLFNGRYCLLQFEVPDSIASKAITCEEDDSHPLEVHLGICLPAGCSLDETRQLVEYVADHQVSVHCQPPRQWPLLAQIFLSCLLLWVAIVLVATAVNWFCEDDDEKSNNLSIRLFNSICLQRNLREALRTTRTHSHQYHSVQGIQVVSVVVLIFGNLFYLVMPYLENVGYAYYLSELPISQPIINFSFHLDALLVIGALRLATKPSTDFSTVRHLMFQLGKHFLRIWPAYAFVTAFVTILYIRLGEGPMWSQSLDVGERCSRTWWVNLLLINNLFGHSMTCLDGGFLIALEAQFFLLAILLMYLSAKFQQRLVTIFICSAITASMLYTFAVAFYYETPETLIPTASNLIPDSSKTFEIFANNIYLSPVARVAPFLLGVLLPRQFETFFLFSNPHISKAAAPLVSMLCIFLAFMVIWTPYLLSFYAGDLYNLVSASYCSAHRFFWAFVILYTAHLLNKADPKNALNSLLGWRIFHPLSKLVYVVFLVSEPVALSLFSSLHRPIYATPLSTMLTSVGTLCCSYIIALLIDVGISRPIRNIVYILT
uniref:Nose resistant-to-fluoxetine protein N-terminal domain-containing protein n=1 Tax=Ditylenchus dipsaci TaxID=166011 RepID=A0A915CTC2_9BILA